MAQARPSSYVALALSALVLALATWWAWSTFTGIDPDEDAARRAADFLRLDEYPEGVAEEAAPPAPQRKPRDLDPDRAPLKPPEFVDADVVSTPPAPRLGDPAPPPPRSEPEPPPPVKALRGESTPDVPVDAGFPAGARGSSEILVEGGRFWIGSTPTWVDGLANARGVETYPGLELEAPRGIVERDPFWIDRYEVTNHKYFEYLQRTATILYRTSDHPARSLVEIVEYLIPERPANLDVREVTAWQLFQTNLAVLLDAFSNTAVRSRDGVIDLAATYERIRDRPLPARIELTFYDRAPPSHWPSNRYEDKRGAHPVRGVSLEEALDYAGYLGRYVPDEIEWEIAARGPSGLDYPWGSDGRGYADVVNGGKKIAPGVEPFTLPVHLLGGGASWVGCFQMLGNVSEWTTSFLAPYPWSRLVPGPAAQAVLVTRGGSARDFDPYVVRPAFRGWREDDPEGPPRPDRRRLWTGFRTARLDGPGRSRLPIMHYRARKGGQIESDLLVPDIYEGLRNDVTDVRLRIAGHPSALEPRPGVKAIVLQPLRGAALRPAGLARYRFNVDDGLTTFEQLMSASAQTSPVLLGILDTAITIDDLWQPRDGYGFARLDLRRVERAAAPPGTYFVALVGGTPALLRPDLQAAWFVGNRPATQATVNVIERDYPSGVERRARIELRIRGRDRLDLDLEVPLHPSATPGQAVKLRLRLDLGRRDLRRLRKPGFEAGSLR